MLVCKEYLSLQTITIQYFVNFIMRQNHLEDLLKCRLLEASPDLWIPYVWNEA